MKKKILIVAECFYPEEFKINDVAFSWVSKGYSVDILTLSPTYPVGKVFPGYKNKFPFSKQYFRGLKIYRIFAVTGYRENFFKKLLRFVNFMFIGTIAAIFIGRKYDYIFGFNTGALTSMMPAVVASKIYKTPLMFWVQDVWPDSLYAFGLKKNRIISGILNVYVSFMHKNLSAIAISGKGFKEALKPYVNNNLKFNYLPNWADDLDMSLSPAILSKDSLIHFTFAGNIGKQQNLEAIITAFISMPDKYVSKAQLNIIGDGPKASDLKILSSGNKNVVFHGKQIREKMSSFYKASDFLIVSLVDKPIFSITVPAKTQTYIAAKRPILAIINGDTSDIINDNSLGLSANPSEVHEISSLFKRCIKMDNAEKAKFICNNDNLLLNSFNKDRIIDQLLSILIKA